MKKLNGAVEFKKELTSAEVEKITENINKFAYANADIWGWHYQPNCIEVSSYAMAMYTHGDKTLHMSIEEGYEDVTYIVSHVAITTGNETVLVCNSEVDGGQAMFELEADDYLDGFAKMIKGWNN